MEVRLNSDLQAKLAQLASERGRDTEALVVEAVERMVNYDDWFIREVEKGIAADREAINAKIKRGIDQLDRGEGIPEERLDTYLANLKTRFIRHRHNS
jgi:predicted transcriptional regulator